MEKENIITGAEIVIKCLIKEKIKYIFGYPGGAIMPIYDFIYKYRNDIFHILTRHEQGAIHAAQGYARATGKVGVCISTSGPGATNLITGLADSLIDSTPIVCITGQVPSNLLGTDAFQETNIMDISIPATKWNVQITNVNDISNIISQAFYIAKSGRSGPVLVDITKDAQTKYSKFEYHTCNKINNFNPYPEIDEAKIILASQIIDGAKKPMIIIGQGIILANAEKELQNLYEKTGIPVASTLLGLGAINNDHYLYMGMLGMHGNYAPNIMTNKCDVLISIGMRFDDRVTGDIKKYAKQAQIIHLDIDPSEINKNIKSDISIIGDCKLTIPMLTKRVKKNQHKLWKKSFLKYKIEENNKITKRDILHKGDKINMTEVIQFINTYKKDDAILVTDVGQHQMIASRYFNFKKTKSQITSGGLGTMGFALPAAIGAQIGLRNKQIICIVGDGGIQMTIQELGTIIQNDLPIKIIILNNNFLGMVRQWQQLFFEKRYSCTELINPNFVKLADAYNISGKKVSKRKDLENSIFDMLNFSGPFLLDILVEKEYNVFPMIPSGAGVDEIRLE